MTFWNTAPFIRLLLPFIIGIVWAVFGEPKIEFAFGLVIAFTLIASLLHLWKKLHTNYLFSWVYGTVISMALFTCGYSITQWNNEIESKIHYSHFYQSKHPYVAKVVSKFIEKSKSYKVELNIIAVLNDSVWEKTNGRIVAYFEKDSTVHQIKYGNTLICNASLNEIRAPSNPHEFNYKRYLRFHNIYHQAYLTSGKWAILNSNEETCLISIAEDSRNRLMNILERYGITGSEHAVASALILGYKDEIDNELKQAYASAGAMHVLAVSGLHVGIIFVIVSWLLSFLEKVNYGNWIKAVLVLLVLWIYALLTGLSPSVVRAATMFSFVVVGKAMKRNTNIYNTLASSAFLLLALNPYFLMEVGFQLSYMAVIGIIYLQPKMYYLWAPNYRWAGTWGNWLLDKIWALSCVSIAAQVATFPLGLLYFHQFPNYFLLSNLIVIPLATLILQGGIILFAVSMFPVIAETIGKALNMFIWVLNYSVQKIDLLPYSLLKGVSINVFETWLIYLIIVLVLVHIATWRFRYLNIALLIALILLGYQNMEAYIQHKQRAFIVYNIAGHTAIDLVEGQQNVLFADSALISDNNKLTFHIRQNWWARGLDNQQLVTLQENLKYESESILTQEKIFQFHNRRFALVDSAPSGLATNTKLKVDYVVVTKNPKLTISQIAQRFEFKKIIFDASNAEWKVEKWMKQAVDLGVFGHATAANGAFVINF